MILLRDHDIHSKTEILLDAHHEIWHQGSGRLSNTKLTRNDVALNDHQIIFSLTNHFIPRSKY